MGVTMVAAMQGQVEEGAPVMGAATVLEDKHGQMEEGAPVMGATMQGQLGEGAHATGAAPVGLSETFDSMFGHIGYDVNQPVPIIRRRARTTLHHEKLPSRLNMRTFTVTQTLMMMIMTSP